MKKRSIPLYYYPVAILFVALFTLSALPATAQTVIELPATADVNVAASTPGRNFGTCDELWVGAAFTRRTLIKFDLSLLPSTSTINSATLSLYQYGTAGADTLEVNIHKINNSWIEGTGTCSSGTSGITWTGHTASGFFETSISANTKISSTPGDKMINISTALVQDWINTPSNNNGILLKLASEPSSGHRSRRFRSKEAANPAERPKLIIGYNSGFPISRCQGVDMITFTAPAKAGVTYTYSMDLNGLWAGNTINPATGEITFAAGWFGETVITATPSTGDYKVTHTITTKRQLGDLKFENDTSYRCQGAGSAIYMAYVNFPDSVRYSLDEASLDAGNTIDSVTRVVTFVETWSGTSTITARAYGCIGDNLGTKIATHKVITQNNLMAIEDRVEMFQGETAQIDVMKNDVCDFDPDKLSILTPPQFGAATLIGTGVNRKIQYKPNSPFFYGTDTLTYRICNTDETACDTATVYINVKQDVTEVCIGATLPKTFYLPFPENASQLRKALLSSTSSNTISSHVRSLISIKISYPGTVIIYDHWEDGYETDITNPKQVTTLVWGDGNPANGVAPGYPNDIIPPGGNIVLDNQFQYNDRDRSILTYDGKDKLYSTTDIVISKVSGDARTLSGNVALFALQNVKSNVYDTEHFGRNYILPVGENTTNNLNLSAFNYVGVFIRAMKDNTLVNFDYRGDGSHILTKTINEGDV